MNYLDVIIGLDFGTASTKVVMQTPYYYGKQAVPVNFKYIDANYSFLLPSQIYLSNDGYFSLKYKSNYSILNNLKFKLINSEKSLNELLNSKNSVYITAFLANVISYSKKYFIETQKQIYQNNFKFRWWVNIGIPSAGYDDEDLRLFFRAITWIASEFGNSIDNLKMQDIEKKLSNIKKTNIPEEFQVIPEVISEAIGYAKSPEKDPGLHFIMDVGASTLDLTSFILAESEGDDSYTILYTDVVPLGTLPLYRLRQKKVFFDIISWYHKKMNEIKSFEPIPDNIHDYFPDDRFIQEHSLEKYEKKFLDQCTQKLNAMVFSVHKNRAPFSRRWNEKLPLFMCGGGSHLEFYHRVVEYSSYSITKYLKDLHGYNKKRLNKPSNLIVDDGEIDYTRLAVAYGLSIPYDDIGRIIPQNKVANIERKRSTKYDNLPNYYDKDMV